MINIVQKIDTGGTSSTTTPILKLRMNELLFPIEARHMTHCASAESKQNRTAIAAIISQTKLRNFITFSIAGFASKVPAAYATGAQATSLAMSAQRERATETVALQSKSRPR
jgi:hypothetical protein